MKIAVLADTHIPKRAKAFPAQALELLRTVDAIIHAGDLLTTDFLSSLNAMAPVFAVKGNNDVGLNLPKRIQKEFENVQIASFTIAARSREGLNACANGFPERPWLCSGTRTFPLNFKEEGLLLLNPGSPTDKRMQPHFTMGLLHCLSGVATAEIIVL